MDCEAISDPSPRGGASEIVPASRTRPSSGGRNRAYGDLPPTQGVLNLIAFNSLKAFDFSNPEELNGYLQYLRDVRKVLFVGAQEGSLIIILECSTLEILDGLWEDYCSGHLNEMAQKYLVADEILEAFGLIAVKLTTTILVKEYTACREYFLQSAGKFESCIILCL